VHPHVCPISASFLRNFNFLRSFLLNLRNNTFSGIDITFITIKVKQTLLHVSNSSTRYTICTTRTTHGCFQLRILTTTDHRQKMYVRIDDLWHVLTSLASCEGVGLVAVFRQVCCACCVLLLPLLPYRNKHMEETGQISGALCAGRCHFYR
jgi:hypothetical protein